MLRLPKDLALNFAKQWTPIYAEIFQELKAEGGRIQAGKRFSEIRQKFGASYVFLYDHERKPGIAIMLALLGEDGFKQFNQDSTTWSEQEITNFFKDIESQEFQDELLDHLNLPESEAEWAEQKALFESLPEDQKTASQKVAAFLFSGVFAYFFNTMALMTHGATMTSLIAQAMQGDDEAFGKAVQVDRFLLTHHPDFMARKQRAQDEGDRRFLSALAYRESNPNLKGKIRYPALFMLFGLLESFQWLDSLRHEEILDLCDEIGLDRFQNRIEDVNYLTKRLIEYRRFQKTGGLSMQ